MYIEWIKQLCNSVKMNEQMLSVIELNFQNIFSYITDNVELNILAWTNQETNNKGKESLKQLKRMRQDSFVESCELIDMIAEQNGISPLFGSFLETTERKEKIAVEIFEEFWEKEKSYILKENKEQ